jgi:alkylation response protein AidB-like acyl-CoA dehydrogenase
MDLTWSNEAEQFRVRLRNWLGANLSADWHARCRSLDSYIEFQRDWDHKLAAAGLSGFWWPKEYGGSGASPELRAVYAEEMSRANAPDGLTTLGLRLLAPAIMKFGTGQQKAELLPPILSAQVIWCQGFSEPEAGSDLASVRTRAVQTDGGFIVSGSKIWTSRAHYADAIFLLARTDLTAEKHAGLTMLLVDMHSPGIEISPLAQINGQSNFNQVFFNDVRVPKDRTLGGIGDGWRVALYILTHERGATGALSASAHMEHHLRLFRQACECRGASGGEGLGRSALETAIVRLLAYRILAGQLAGNDPGYLGSAVKLFWSESWQRLAETALLEAGPQAFAEYEPGPFADDTVARFMDTRQRTIAGGTSEIQREIISQHMLGLPRK